MQRGSFGEKAFASTTARTLRSTAKHNSHTVQLNARRDRNVDNARRPKNQFVQMASRAISGLRPSWYSTFDADYGAVSCGCRKAPVPLLRFVVDLDVAECVWKWAKLNCSGFPFPLGRIVPRYHESAYPSNGLSMEGNNETSSQGLGCNPICAKRFWQLNRRNCQICMPKCT